MLQRVSVSVYPGALCPETSLPLRGGAADETITGMWDYYVRFWAVYRQELVESTREQLVGALLTLGIFVVQLKYQIIRPGDARANFWAIVWPYLTLVGSLLLWHLIRTPFNLDGERQQAENVATEKRRELEERIEKLEDDYFRGRPRIALSVRSPKTREEWARLANSDGNYTATFFEIKHLGGRAATYINVFPIPSDSGMYTMIFEPIAVVDGKQMHELRHTIQEGENMGPPGFGNTVEMMLLFLKDNPKQTRMSFYRVELFYHDGDKRYMERANLICDRPELKLHVGPPD